METNTTKKNGGIKKYALITGLIIAGALGYFYLDKYRSEFFTNQEKSTGNIKILNENKNIFSSPDMQNDKSIGQTLTPEDVIRLNAANLAEIKLQRYKSDNWFSARGYLSPDEQALYRSYELNSLQAMGAAGDQNALTELANRANQNENFELAMQYYEAATIHGASSVLPIMASKYEMANKLYLDANNGKQALMAAISYFRLAELRGDYTDSTNIEKYLSNFGAYSIGKYGEVKLDENDLQKVESTAREMYESLEEKRIELGLGPFDNSTPDGGPKILKDSVLAERAKNKH